MPTPLVLFSNANDDDGEENNPLHLDPQENRAGTLRVSPKKQSDACRRGYYH